MAKTPAAPAPDDATQASSGSGKNRPTPSRAAQEAARKRPLVADTKEAKARARAELAERRDKARIGMANGDERYLPVRDKGPQRRFVRDYVDAGWHLGELVMGAMVLVIIVTFVGSNLVTFYAFIGLWAFILLVIGDMVLTSRRVKKGLGWYGAMRSIQMRFMRLPKPQVKRGQRPA